MPRRDDAPAISLFSFQDIITSITGIMFLVVLMLVLLILDVREVAEPGRPSAADIAALRDRLHSLRRELALRSAGDRELEARIAALRALHLDEMEERLHSLRGEISAQECVAAALRGELEQNTRTLNALERDVQSLSDRKAAKERLFEERSGELAASEKIVEALEKREAIRRRLVHFTIDQAFGKSPVLVECGADGIRVLEVRENRRHDFRDGAASAERFLNWAKSRNSGEVYFSLLVKPAAFGYARLLRTALGEAGFQRGYEIMPGDEFSIFDGEE